MKKALLACLLLGALAATLQGGAAATTETCNVANCKTCTDPPKKCDACTSTTTDPKILLQDGSACKSCPQFCAACTEGAEGTTLCDTCKSFHYKLADKTCEYCPGHCEKCSSTGVCSTCESTYKMVSKETTCSSCPANCASCADATTCWTCVAGYYLDANGDCQQCPGGSDCLSCKDNTECLVCDEKQWDSTANNCVDCHAECEVCDTKDGCTKCKKDFFLGSDKKTCHSCSNCDGTCSDKTGCSKCKGGYHKIPDGRCVVCQDQFGVNTICEGCRSTVRGQLYSSSTCLYCPENCEVCTSETVCTTCKTGYTKVGSECKDCTLLQAADLTTLSASQSDCTACSNLYYDSSTCSACPTAAADFVATSAACDNCGDRIHGAKYKCNTLTCSATDASGYSQTQCEICYKQGHAMYWDSTATTPVCTTVSDCTATTLPEAECKGCRTRTWDSTGTGSCTNLVCSASITDEVECLKCNYIYDSGSCTARAAATACTTATLKADCTCLQWYWNGTHCSDQSNLDCTSVATLDSYACDGCRQKLQEDTAVTTANEWAVDTGNECYDCPAGCDVCAVTNGEVKCTTTTTGCLVGYTLVTANEMCQKCPTGCRDCDTTDANLPCNAGRGTKCIDGYYETSTGSGCAACPANCDECSAANSCSKCAEGYIWDSTIGTGECVDCVFETSNECTSCLGSTTVTGRYFDSSNLCQECPTGCTKCSSDGTTCTACSSAYWLDSSSSTTICTACPGSGGLTAADTEKKCSVCGLALNGGVTGAFWDSSANSGSGGCTACPTNCQSCTSATSCKTCRAAYYFDSAATPKVCKACVSGCLECSSADTCTKCSTGKYFDSTSKTCINCDTNCNVTAIACNTVSGCSVCDDDYYLDGQTCKSCTDLDAECLHCSSKTVCTKCSMSHYPKGDKCEDCPKNCEVCDGKTCSKCASGHCWDSSKKECFAKSGCKECKSDGTTVTCTLCQNEYGLDICQMCSQANCLKCDADLSKCQKCADGYYVSDTGACSGCPGGTNCKVCKDNKKCTTCKDGYYWDSSTEPGNCKACGTACAKCSSSSTCSKCSSTGQYWDKTAKSCKSCPTDCFECSDDKSCNSCNNGTVWDSTDSVCTTCVDNCWHCKNATVCEDCLPGMYLTTGATPSCESCGDGCLSCSSVNDSVVCNTCQAGYLLNKDGGCDACDISSCTQCSDPAPHCATCSSGFVLTSDKGCSVPCYKCSGTGCDKVQGVNSTVEACSGLGSTHSCWITMTSSGSSVSYTRSCKASKCSSSSEVCSASGSSTVCTKCCTTGKCNSGKLVGQLPVSTDAAVRTTSALGSLMALMAVVWLL